MALSQQEKEKLVGQVRKEYQAGLDFRRKAETRWKLAEDLYFNKQQKSLKQRYNVPVPIVPGFVDTLLSKIDDPPALKFEQVEEADYKAVQKANAFYAVESQAEDHDWDMLDLDGKKQAILYGRAIKKYWAESVEGYKSNLEVTDVYDFIADPVGGGNLERHLFVMQDNLFRSKAELKAGVKSGIYDKQAVEKIINATKEDTLVDNDNQYRSKQSRMMSLGMDGVTYNYAGQALYKFIETGTYWNGERYYVVWNPETGVAIRCEILKDVFKSNLWPWVSWATHRDVFNFWSKAPVDDIVPLSEMIKTLVNQELDNRMKKNWGMRAYDPEIFPNPAELEWRADGLVRMKAGSSSLKVVDKAIYQFETPELQGTINLVNWIDNMLGQKTGVSADAQGDSSEDKVGIYYGNLQQIADRLGLYNKSYRKAWSAIGRRYLWGLFEHLRSPQAVMLIGEKGNEWDEIVRTEINPKWNIKVEGGNAELAQDEMKKKNRQAALAMLAPDELMVINPKWRAEQKLRTGDFEEEDIRLAFDTQNDGNRELLAEASQALQDLVAGKQPKLNRGANTAFLQKLVDFAIEETDGNDALFNAVMAYAEAHKPIVAENMARKAMMEAPTATLQPAVPGAPAPSEPIPGITATPPQGTFEGTASRSQEITNMSV